MKIPETKPEQIKLLIVVALVSVLVILGIAQLVIVPLRNSSKDRHVRLRQCEDELKAAQRVVEFVPRDREENTKALERIKKISTEHILQPVLGNYALSANGIIERHLRNSSLEAESITEIGITEAPQGGKNPNAIKCYTSRVTLFCGYESFVKLLQSIEDENPYICIVGLQIASRTAIDPENHSITFDVQWPIWVDPKTPSLIDEELKTNAEIRI